MSESDNSPDDGVTTNQLTQLILKEVRPYLQPNKIHQAEQQIGAMVVHELHQEFHQGPLPAPRQLVQYEQALSGSAERIMAMAENEQNHRHTNETRLIKGEVTLKFIGQALAFAALIVMICLIGYMVQKGYPIQAASLGAVMITGVVGLFLAPKFFHQQEQPPAKKATPKTGRGGRRK
ncbi:DUF2335 domain-containing protein [Brevundimonas sp. SL161]|uniref:DUF2335 domain-containing protein n=1 Tax=Brevundimonas sp. SL161 TaxID=2804613 RepID=UPI003CE9774C